MSDANNPKWWQNSNIQSALITGALGLMGTIVTIYATRPAPQPIAPYAIAPTPAPVSPTHGPPVQDDTIPHSSEPNLRLNFAAFQKSATDVHMPAPERKEFIAPLVGKQVVWEGYYDGHNILNGPTEKSYFTVSLVESRDKLTQSMFKTPALFRMPQSELAKAESLQSGDKITLMGTLESHSLIGTIITDGHLMKAPVRTAQSPSNAMHR